MKQVTLKIHREGEAKGLPLPAYETPGSAGMDLRASEEVLIDPGCWLAVGTGLFLEIPQGYEVQLRPRSGLALNKGVTLLNAPGTIDSDYRGEVRVILINHSKEPFQAQVGDRIAQMVLKPVVHAIFCEVDQLEETSRGAGGFGSTGGI